MLLRIVLKLDLEAVAINNLMKRKLAVIIVVLMQNYMGRLGNACLLRRPPNDY